MFKVLGALLLLCCAGMAQSLGTGHDDDGVLPRKAKVEVTFAPVLVDGKAVEVNGQLLEHATLAVAGVPCDLFMLGDEVAVSLAGVVIVSGAPSVLDGLPGGNQSATAGTHGCYGVTHHTANGDVIVPTDIPSTGHGNTLGQAVAACKADADVLAHEYVPLPWGSCN